MSQNQIPNLTGQWATDIVAAEAAGQRALLQSTVLPVRGSENPAILAMGFTFGAPVKGDDLFREATLPAGWKRDGSNHNMWSYIVDERGIQRVAVFYKAAPYDRRADMNPRAVAESCVSQFQADPPVAIPWDLLTDEEKADTLTRLRNQKTYLEETISKGRGYPDEVATVERITAELAKFPEPAVEPSASPAE